MTRKAFTLIELIFVVTITAFLGAIAWSMYSSSVAKAHWGDVAPCLSSVALRLENYRAFHGNYPDGDVFGELGLTSDCGDYYQGKARVFNQGMSYIVAYADSKRRLDNAGPDIWAQTDSSGRLLHVSSQLTKTEPLPDGYSLPL